MCPDCGGLVGEDWSCGCGAASGWLINDVETLGIFLHKVFTISDRTLLRRGGSRLVKTRRRVAPAVARRRAQAAARARWKIAS